MAASLFLMAIASLIGMSPFTLATLT